MHPCEQPRYKFITFFADNIPFAFTKCILFNLTYRRKFSYGPLPFHCRSIINSDLSINPSASPAFPRFFACVILKPYIFSLVFALMSRNKGNFLFSADYLIQQSCGSTLRFPCRVSVNVHCGTDISVSEKFLHIFRCCTV